MAKNPWDVVSVEPAEASDPWAVVSVDEAPKSDSFFSLDRAKEVALDAASLIPGLGGLAKRDDPPAEPKVQMTPQQIERQAAVDATERENLRAINPGAKDYQINALLEQKRAANPMPTPTLDDRAAGYLETNPTMTREDAQRNATFDVALEQRMNRKFQKAEADPITGERIAVAYQPEREAERTAFERSQLDQARANAIEADRRKDLKAMADENPLTMGVVQSLATMAAGMLQAPGTAERAVRQALGFDPSESVIPKSELAQRIYDVVRDTTADAARVDLVDAIGTEQFFPALTAQMAQNSVSNLMSLAAIFAPPLRALILPGMGAMASGTAELGGNSALAAVGKGAVEVGSELAFVKAFDKLGDLIKAIPPAARNTVLATAGNRLLRTGATVTYAGLTGAIEEAAAQVGGNVIDRLDGQSKSLMDGVGSAAILGAAAGKVMGVPAAIGAATQPASRGGVLAGELADALSADLVDDTQQVVDFANRNYTTGGEIRPEATSKAAAIAAEQVKLESMRSVQTQATREAEASITAANTVDEAIELASNAVSQGSILSDITQRVSQNSQLAATLEALGANESTTPVTAAGQPIDAGAAPSVQPAQPATAAAGLAGADATVAGGQPNAQPALTYPTAEAATAAAQQMGVADQVDVADTSQGYVLAPRTKAPTVRELREQSAAVSSLNEALAQTGAPATVELRAAWATPAADAVQDGDVDGGGAGADFGLIRQVADVAGRAFGVAPIPVRGLGNLGVAYNGRLYVDLDEVAANAKATNNAEISVAVATIGHEATHALLEKSSDPKDREAYANFRAVVLAYARPGLVQRRQQSETQAAGGPQKAGMYGTRAYAEGEVVADVSGAMWLDPKFWERLYDVDNGSTFRRVMYKFMQAATRFMEVAKGSRLDAGRFVTNVEAVREAAAQAWATRARGQKPPAELASAPQFKRTDRINFEVAPDPNNQALSAKWNELNLADKLRISRKVADRVVPQVLTLRNAEGGIVEQTGSYEKDTNPSFALRLTKGDTQAVSMDLGYVLSQDSMMNLSRRPFRGGQRVGAVSIELGDLGFDRVKALYDQLRETVPEVGGQSFVAGEMIVLNYSNTSTSDLAQKIDAALGGQYNVSEDVYYSSFPTKKDYDYGSSTDDTGAQGEAERSIRQRLGGLRAEASRLIEAELPAYSRAGGAGSESTEGADRVRDGAGRPDAQRSGGDGVVAGAPVRAPGRPSYGQPREGAVSAVGVHYSRQPRTSLNSSYYGSGLKGLEAERLQGSADIRPRIFFYVDRGNGVRPEAGVGGFAHEVELTNLYDVWNDPLGIVKSTRGMPDRENAWERAIMEAGFDGYLKRDPVMPQHFAVLVGKKHGSVPVAQADPRRADGKANAKAEPPKPKNTTRTEGEELVRKPEGQELSQIVRVREEVKFVAPSFRLQYGEARVLASEAAAADQVLADAGSSFQFGVPQFSRNDDFDELGAFNLDANDWTDGIEVTKKDDLDFEALQAELEAEMNQGRERPAGRGSIEEPTDQQLKDAGLHPEKVVAFGPHTVRSSDIILQTPGYLRVEHGVNYTISGFQGEYAPRTELDSYSTFVSGGKRMTEAQAVQFTQNQLAAEYLHKRFDLAQVYRKSTVMKIAEGWNALAKVEGAMKYPGAETQSKSFPEIAMAMGMLKDYKITVEYDEVVIFKNRKTGREFQATIMERGRDMACCTMGLNGSDLGVPFYVVAAKMAQNIGKPFVADETLSAINTLRRTEQALSFALRTGDTGVLLPGPQNRVYGYNNEPKTKADHNENIARLALANLRNVEELIPEVRRWTYDPETGQFGDEAKVSAALADPDVRAMGVGRTTVARAVLTNQLVMNTLQPGDVANMATPVLYSRVTVEQDPQPLSESWGELDAQGEVELNPKFKAWFGDSKVVDDQGKPLVVYHGTRADVAAFRLDAPRNMAAFRDAQGFYFSKFPDDASAYTEGDDGDPASGANVMPVFLQMSNPLRVEAGDMDNHPAYISERRLAALEADGYDGIIYADGVEYVVFRSEQVKSAIGNNGDFDPANPDIRFSRRSGPEQYWIGDEFIVPDVPLYEGVEDGTLAVMPAFKVGGVEVPSLPIKAKVGDHRTAEDEGSKNFGAQHLVSNKLTKNRSMVADTGDLAEDAAREMAATALTATRVYHERGNRFGFYSPVTKRMMMTEWRKERGGHLSVVTSFPSNGSETKYGTPAPIRSNPDRADVKKGSDLSGSGTARQPENRIAPMQDGLGRLPPETPTMQPGGPTTSQVALELLRLPLAPSRGRTTYIVNQEGYISRAQDLAPVAETQTGNPNWPDKKVFPGLKAGVHEGGGAYRLKDGTLRFLDAEGNVADGPQMSRGLGLTLDPEGKWLKTQRLMQDYFNRVDQVQQMIARQGGVVREQNDTYRAEERSYGRIHEAIKDFADKWVQPMVEKAAKAGVTMDELSLYAYAMHAKERNARVARINPNLKDGGSGMKDAEADAIIAQVNADPRAAVMKDLHQDLMAITATTRRVLLEEGLITEEQYTQLDGMYQNYVPLRGFENESDPRIQQLLEERSARMGTGQGYSIKGGETLRALGRRTRAGDIIENIINDYQRAVVRGEKNAVARTFYQFVLDNPAPNLWEIDADKTKRSLGLDGMVKEKVVLDTDDNTTLAVKLNGNEVFIKVKDPLLVRALKKMHNNDMGEQLRTITNGLSLYTALLRNTLTRFNPEFAIVNLVRDAGFGTMAVLDELGEPGVALFWKHYAAANAAAHRYEMGRLDPVNNVADRYFTEYRMAGGTTGGFYMKDADQVRGDIRDMMLMAGAAPQNWVEKLKAAGGAAGPYRAARAAGRVLEHIGAVSENAARAAAYRAARDMGKTHAEAAKIAKNLTTNFNRKGEYGQLLNTLFVFYNAAVQGSQRTVKLMKNPKVQKYLAGMVASSMAIALANAWGAGDDEDDGEAYWDKIPAHVKERNLIIMLPPGSEDGERVGSNGRYVAIPVQYGLNIFTTLGYALADTMRHYGQDKTRGHGVLEGAAKLASVTLGSFNPFGGSLDNKHAAAMMLLPSAADVVYQLANGVNSFGTPVAPFKSELDAKPDSENVNARQAGGPAHAIARWVNEVTGGDDTVAGEVDLTPGTLENVWGNLTGGTGRFINDVLTLGMNGLEYANGGDPDIFINKVPVFRKVYGEVDGGVDQGLFYDRRRQIQEARQETKAKEESGREVNDSETLALDSMASDANKFTRAMADIRKQMVEIGKDPDMTPTEKRVLIRELKAERDTLTREFNRMFIETMRAEAQGDFAVAE